jgi:hypothetical protein
MNLQMMILQGGSVKSRLLSKSIFSRAIGFLNLGRDQIEAQLITLPMICVFMATSAWAPSQKKCLESHNFGTNSDENSLERSNER